MRRIGAGVGTADGRGQAIYSDLVARIEEHEQALKELIAEVARLSARQDAQERDWLAPGGNFPPEEFSIDDAVNDVEFGIASLRILRAVLGGELPQLGAEIQSTLLKWAYEGLKRACRAVCWISKWVIGAVAAGAAAYVGERYFGPHVAAYLEKNLPLLIEELKPILVSLGM